MGDEIEGDPMVVWIFCCDDLDKSRRKYFAPLSYGPPVLMYHVRFEIFGSLMSVCALQLRTTVL